VNGYSEAEMPDVRRDYCGTLLIVASGHTAWSDLDELGLGNYGATQVLPWDVMCVNDMIMHFPQKMTHAYSNDHLWLNQWIRARRPRYVKDYDAGLVTHTCQCGGSSMKIWPWPGHGTSSLNATYTGLALGYDKIILCGAPLDDGGHYFDPPWVKTNFSREVADRDGHPKFWSTAKRDVFEGKVFSMSGRTMELLGKP